MSSVSKTRDSDPHFVRHPTTRFARAPVAMGRVRSSPDGTCHNTSSTAHPENVAYCPHPPATSTVPSLLNAAATISRVWPVSGPDNGRPVSTSHSRSSVSPLFTCCASDTRIRSSSLTAAPSTRRSEFVDRLPAPRTGARSRPFSTTRDSMGSISGCWLVMRHHCAIPSCVLCRNNPRA